MESGLAGCGAYWSAEDDRGLTRISEPREFKASRTSQLPWQHHLPTLAIHCSAADKAFGTPQVRGLSFPCLRAGRIHVIADSRRNQDLGRASRPVSYTHLTLPTSDLV